MELSEKAKSKAQQRFFGLVRAAQKGEMKNPSDEVLDVADDISVKDAKKFAKTKHKGLPEKKVKKEEASYGQRDTELKKTKVAREHRYKTLHKKTNDSGNTDVNEGSFDIDPQKHRKAKRDAKIRNLAKDNKNPNEKSAAERKLKGPKLAWEEFKILLPEMATKAEVQARLDKMPEAERAKRMIGTLGRNKKTGEQQYGMKLKQSRKNQARRRGEGLKDVDSDLPSKTKERGERKTKKIIGRGKEAHHLTQVSQSTKEFKGLSPEQRKAKREKDAKQHKYHGSDPRNLAQTEGPKGGKGIPHRGEKGYHSSQKAVGSGGEGKNFGSEAQIVSVKKRKESRERKRKELGRD